MKKYLLALLSCLFFSSSNATVLNFDSYADGTILSIGSLDSIGVHFNQNLQVDDGDDGGLALSTPNYVFNNDSLYSDITGYFLGPVTSVDFISIYAGDSGGDIDTVTLSGYDIFNNLVDTATFSGSSAQTLSISGSAITRFEIVESGLIGIDDFTFNPTSVPEPTSLALLGLGLAGFGFLRKKKAAV